VWVVIVIHILDEWLHVWVGLDVSGVMGIGIGRFKYIILGDEAFVVVILRRDGTFWRIILFRMR